MDITMLDYTQLRKLALLLRNKEESLMTRKMKSQNERIQYLESVNDAYDNVIELLNRSNKVKNEYAKGTKPEVASIAKDILGYMKYGLNMSMQNVRNCSVRVSCIGKIKTHFNALMKDLENLNPGNVANVRLMAKDVAKYKECMWEYSNKCRSASARARSKAFSMVVKQKRITFPDLVQRHQNKLGFKGEFESLAEAQKLEVYNSIIRESGRAKIPKLELTSTAVGVGVLVVTSGLMVWDIFTAEHKLEAVLRNSLSALSDVGSFLVQVAVEAAVTSALVEMELGVFVVAMAGFVAGCLAGLLFAAGSGLIIDMILGSGGKIAPDLSELKFHTATMPDGMGLANQIAHDS